MLSRDIAQRLKPWFMPCSAPGSRRHSRAIACENIVHGAHRAGHLGCRVGALLGLRAKVGVGVEAVQAVRHVVLQPQRCHRALAEVCRIQHLRGTVSIFSATTTANELPALTR